MASEIRGEDVTLDVNGEKMPTYVALPAGAGPHPAVIVFQEIFGVNAHIRDVSNRLAREGYVAIAPDYHHRAWEPGTQRGYTDETMKQGMQLIPKLTVAGLKADIDATIAYLGTRKDVDVKRLGAIGFCIGGHAAYFAAEVAPAIKATASFYGGGIATFGLGAPQPTVTRTKEIKGKMLAFFGKKDPMIPQDQVETIKKALADSGVEHEVVVYDDASHAFFCDARGNYEPKAAADAWERVKKFFARELK
jgi:carboxymethylenebutenolidase